MRWFIWWADLPAQSRFTQTDDATLDRMLDMNLKSAFFMARAVLPHMRSSRQWTNHIAIGIRAGRSSHPPPAVSMPPSRQPWYR